MAIVSDEQVIKVLRQYNPWWRNPLAIKEENKPQKRLALLRSIENDFAQNDSAVCRFIRRKACRQDNDHVSDDEQPDRRGRKPQKYPVCILRQSDCKACQCGDSPFYLRIPLSHRGNKVYLPR